MRGEKAYKWVIDLHKINSLTGKPDKLVFDTEQEANEWLRLVDNPKFQAVKTEGVIVSEVQPVTSGLSSVGIWGRSVKVWIPKEEKML